MLAHPDDRLRPDLRAAIEAACTRPGTVRTLFQPIIDVPRGATAGFEALTRFALEPQMTPDRWFAAAYGLGLGPRLEAACLRSALGHRDALPANSFLSVNVGPVGLLSPEVGEVLAAAGDLRGLVIELTEQDAVEDYDALLAILAPLRAAGALLAIDDAGAGFASLAHITRLRPEIVKIDRGHVSGIDQDPAKEAVVHALGDFASRLDAWVVAEGVETRAELDVLASLGVPLAQGYFLGRPSPAMAPASPEAVDAHRQRADRHDAGPLGPLLSPAVCFPEAASARDVAQAFLADAALRCVLLVDEHDRPVRLARRGGSEPSVVMCAGLDAEPAVLARRVVTRPEAVRFDPVAICDELGRAVGLLSIERLLLSLAER